MKAGNDNGLTIRTLHTVIFPMARWKQKRDGDNRSAGMIIVGAADAVDIDLEPKASWARIHSGGVIAFGGAMAAG